MDRTELDFDRGPEGLGFADRLQYLADCFERADLSMLDRFSPMEVYEVMTSIGHQDEDLVRHIRICQEVGSAFLHPGLGCEEDDDEEFLGETLQCVFPELEELRPEDPPGEM
jgi:hypothetical protein